MFVKNSVLISEGAASIWLSSGLNEWFLFTFTIFVPKYKIKFFYFSLKYWKFYSSDLRTKKLSPEIYSSSSNAYPERIRQSQGTTSPSFNIKRSPGNNSRELTCTISKESAVTDLAVWLPPNSEGFYFWFWRAGPKIF